MDLSKGSWVFILSSIICFLLATPTDQACTPLFEQQILTRHNAVRALHGVPGLTLDGTITEQFAQPWADELLSRGTLDHRPNNPTGENLFSSFVPQANVLNGNMVVNVWYNEIELYRQFFNREPDLSSFEQWGHFTQVIWRASARIGVGCGISGNGQSTFVVVNYAPKGNIVGNFSRNVPAPIAEQTTPVPETTTLEPETTTEEPETTTEEGSGGSSTTEATPGGGSSTTNAPGGASTIPGAPGGSTTTEQPSTTVTTTEPTIVSDPSRTVSTTQVATDQTTTPEPSTTERVTGSSTSAPVTGEPSTTTPPPASVQTTTVKPTTEKPKTTKDPYYHHYPDNDNGYGNYGQPGRSN